MEQYSKLEILFASRAHEDALFCLDVTAHSIPNT